MRGCYSENLNAALLSSERITGRIVQSRREDMSIKSMKVPHLLAAALAVSLCAFGAQQDTSGQAGKSGRKAGKSSTSDQSTTSATTDSSTTMNDKSGKSGKHAKGGK